MPREKSNPSDEFKAHKLAVQKRLEREGRWPEASRYKETVRLTLVAEKKAGKIKGMTVDEIVKRSWDEMEKAYPPMTAEEIAAKVDRPQEPRDSARAASADPVVVPVPSPPEKPAELPKERATFIAIPKDWGELPPTAKYEDEVEWVYQNYVMATERKSTGCTMRLSRCRTPAPSMGAVALLEWAIDNRTAFFKDVLPKAKKGSEDEDADSIKAERKSIEEIGQILDRMMEVQT